MNEVNVSADCADKRKADGKLNNKGFSLVEMLIALTISGIVLSALVVLIESSVHNFTKRCGYCIESGRERYNGS